MSASNIFHICTSESWKAQDNSKEYVHPSLENEKFIHCSEQHQLQGVLNRYFQNQQNLLLLEINTEKVIPNIIYEKAPNGDIFPHIYGPLNKDAIISIQTIIN